MTDVAVVILNYNGENYLKQFLPSVLKHSDSAQVIVADNASTDGSIQLLKNQFPTVKLVTLPKNYGYAGGYNEALSQIRASYFVLLNSDVEVTENWLDSLIGFLRDHPGYAACQPKLLDFNNRTHFEYAGAAGGFLDTFGYPFCRGRVFDTIEEDKGQYNDDTDIFWASGACMAIRAEAFLDNQGFDGDFFAHMEEIDLCWRIINKGGKIRYIASSKVYHVGGGTLNQTSSFKTYLNFRNSLNVLIKNLPSKSLLQKLFIRWLFDWMAVMRFLLKGDFNHSRSILKAHGSVIGSLKKTLKKRGNHAKRSELYPISVVIAYFLKGKKTFKSFQ